MIGFSLKLDGKNVFVGGTGDTPFIEYCMRPDMEDIDYVIVEISAVQMQNLEDFHPQLVVFTNIAETFSPTHFKSAGEYIEAKIKVIKSLSPTDTLVCNFDTLRI